ncbi:MAG: polysaccharide biosynthesis/export family protein [Paludibacteraceae bacterium]|nr:polysaccharide biosynthesis/export family protein [Paludibacteraceae bacterium]
MNAKKRHIIQVSIQILLVTGILTLITSCVTNKTTRYLQNEKENYAPAHLEEYRLQPNDELNISFGSANADAVSLFSNGMGNTANINSQLTYRIYQDGTIDLPYVSNVHVAGKTLRETNLYLTELLKPYVAEDLVVKTAMADRSYYVIGEAQKGKFSIYKNNMNVFEALAQAGDLTPLADRKRIKILRRVDGKEKIVSFNIRSKDILDSEFYYIEPNDIIFIPQAGNAFFRITTFTSLMGFVTSTLSFVLLVTTYANK